MRPKKCACGGRKPTYQWAGMVEDHYPHENYYEPMSADMGTHNPADVDPNYFKNMQLQNPPPVGKQLSYQPVQQHNQFTPFDAALGIQAGTDILSEISGRVDRGRQNQYRYNQYSTLGQMNPMPTQDFQPNPYNLYAQYGGSLKRYMNFDKRFSNNAHFGTGDEGMHGSMQMGGKLEQISNYIDMIRKKSKYSGGGGLSRSQDYGSSKRPYPSVSSGDFAGGHRSYPIPTAADAVDALRLAHLHGREDVVAKVHAKYPNLAKGGNWIAGAVNPAHKGYCTPMTKSTCTGHRKAFAMMMKKKHGFHK